MKCYQEKNDFKPIIITLTTSEEAQAFFNIIDKVDAHMSVLGKKLVFSKEEKDIIIELSNYLTCGSVVL